MQLENAEICKQLRAHLGKSHDMARILLRIKKVMGWGGRAGRKVE